MPTVLVSIRYFQHLTLYLLLVVDLCFAQRLFSLIVNLQLLVHLKNASSFAYNV